MSDFVYALNELMLERDFTQTQLAEKLGVGVSTISRYLSGQQVPDIEIAIKIADCFNCTFDFLLGLVEDNKTKLFHACPPFKEQFVFLLKRFKISKYKLEKETGISKSTMYYWQVGVNKPSIYNVIKLAKYFNCSVDYIVGRVEFE